MVYRLDLAKDYERVPLNPYYLNKPDTDITLLQASSAVYCEARSYLTEHQTAYIPGMPDMDLSYGEPTAEYRLPQAIKDTVVCAMTDFTSVHFHLHIDPLRREEYVTPAVLASLATALKVYMSRSWPLYLERGLRMRRAVVHLDHLLSLWPKLRHCYCDCVPISTFHDLVNLIAQAKITD
jgi:hypothetical protein